MANTVELNTIEDARQFAANSTVPCFVLSRETLDQIEAAEAAGGFAGGMSGASGEGGFSASGFGGSNSSSSSDPASIELLDPDSTDPVGVFLERSSELLEPVGEVGEKFLDFRDLWEAFEGSPLGPVILVPKRELDRWLGNTDSDA